MDSMNSGYVGWSMSRNAASAYEDGEMPMSKWAKKAILTAIQGFCGEYDLEYDPSVERLAKAELFDRFLEYSSWHHTSKFVNETDFYRLNEDAVRERFPAMTEERIQQVSEQRRRLALEEAREREAAQKQAAHRQAQTDAFVQKHGFRPDTVAAYAQRHPENVLHRRSRSGTEVIEILHMRDGVKPNVYEARRADRTRLYGYNALDEGAAEQRTQIGTEEPKMKMQEGLEYEVYEDNAGGITLCVMENGSAIWASIGYEYPEMDLARDLQELMKGGHPIEDGWDTVCPELDPQALRDDLHETVIARNGGAELVFMADKSGVYEDKLGIAGSLRLPRRNDEEKGLPSSPLAEEARDMKEASEAINQPPAPGGSSLER